MVRLLNCSVFENNVIQQIMRNYVKGLPLALTVVESHLCGRDKAEWINVLVKLFLYTQFLIEL